MRSVGILGYGHLGQFLADKLLKSNEFKLEFIWNRSIDKLGNLPKEIILANIADVVEKSVDLIVEVSHPCVTLEYASVLLSAADYMIGSPTALANDVALMQLLHASALSGHGVYVPSGALWGGEDIRKLDQSGTLQGLIITMKKHPSSFKLQSPLKEVNDKVTNVAEVLYNGPVRQLCALAPNNVNTMAAAAVAAHSIGFDGIVGRLVSDPTLVDQHIVEMEVVGCDGFKVTSSRCNPAPSGAVTGIATYEAFWSSVLTAHGKGSGIHLC